MMYGMGIDLVHVPRIERLLNKYGDRFARFILTPLEWTIYQDKVKARSHKRQVSFLAQHFAVKEAAVKAMGLGFREGMGPRKVGSHNDPKGKPLLHWSEHGENKCAEYGIDPNGFVTITDERDMAAAVVVLMRTTTASDD